MRLLVFAAVVSTALAVTASAGAESLRIKHKPWRAMTTHQKVIVLRKQVHKDKCIIRFWKNHSKTHKASVQTHWARVSLRIASRSLAKLQSRPAALRGWPPHHALWVCIGGYEGSPTSVNPNGHYGMLQMTYNWFGYIKGRASDYPQAVQEWAAERAYENNHYSTSFLWQQWFKWDNAEAECLKYA